MKQLIECVPNFSEGRNLDVLKQITDVIEKSEGVKLLDVDPGFTTNRTVVTFVGTPEEVIATAYKAIAKAKELIDMRGHHGDHPRFGATDVCPLVPVSNITMEETAESKEEQAAKLEELLSEFNGLTGLSGVKHQVNSLVNLMRVQKMRQEQGLKVSDVSKHMVFSGNPGTGKTTVARMLAEIYKYLGVLSKGQLVEVDRGGLVKGFIGQTATRVQEVVDEALGGILFIDEAYTLTVGKGDGDFGQEAVDTLLKSMEDHRDELIVIVAGYTDLMEQFLNSNPGLKSRFSNFIFFEDYTADELMDILHKNLEKQEYVLSEAAEKEARRMIEERVANKPDNFANARDVRNFMEHAISAHACRVVELENVDSDKGLLSTLEVEDLQPFDS